MSITPAAARQRYLATRGADPLFASVDGANCPTVRASDRAGHSLLLNHGLIRVGVTLPANAEFSISVVRDPYGCALQQDPATGQLTVSVYRRPLPAANLGFLSAVMWDARETVLALATGDTFRANLRADLIHQAMDATMGHAQAAVTPTDAQLNAIVDFELGLSSAQGVDYAAGPLDAAGASAGPLPLAEQPYIPASTIRSAESRPVPRSRRRPCGCSLRGNVGPAQAADDGGRRRARRRRRAAGARDIAAGERSSTPSRSRSPTCGA